MSGICRLPRLKRSRYEKIMSKISYGNLLLLMVLMDYSDL